jgi:hypothetical protein
MVAGVPGAHRFKTSAAGRIAGGCGLAVLLLLTLQLRGGLGDSLRKPGLIMGSVISGLVQVAHGLDGIRYVPDYRERSSQAERRAVGSRVREWGSVGFVAG